MRDVTVRAAGLRGLLTRNVTQARQVIRLLLDSRLVCTPFDDGEEHGYTFEAMGTYRRLGVPTLVNVGGGPNGIRHTDVFRPARFLIRLPFEGLALVA